MLLADLERIERGCGMVSREVVVDFIKFPEARFRGGKERERGQMLQQSSQWVYGFGNAVVCSSWVCCGLVAVVR